MFESRTLLKWQNFNNIYFVNVKSTGFWNGFFRTFLSFFNIHILQLRRRRNYIILWNTRDQSEVYYTSSFISHLFYTVYFILGRLFFSPLPPIWIKISKMNLYSGPFHNFMCKRWDKHNLFTTFMYNFSCIISIYLLFIK